MREDLKEHFKVGESDRIALDYYMGGSAETAEEWFERVFTMCEMYQKNNGFDDEGNKLPKVYASSPNELWEQKKIRRKKALVKDLLGKECETDEEEEQALKDCLKHERYKKRDLREKEYKDELEKKRKDKQNKKLSEFAALQKKFDNETIIALRPDLKSLIANAENGIVK